MPSSVSAARFVCNFQQVTRCCVAPPRKLCSCENRSRYFYLVLSQSPLTPRTHLSVQPSATGLPKDVVPRSYLIHLEPNIETRVTDGVESIEIEVLKPTNRIVLNALDTQIAEARIEIGDQAERTYPGIRFEAADESPLT